jgi:hypothetical protein
MDIPLANRALSTLIFGGDYDNRTGFTPAPATLEVGMTKADFSNDFSNKNLGVSGAIIISAWISHKDNGTLTSLDISDNMLCGLYSDGSSIYNGTFVAALSDLLKVNSVLKELNMSKT